jgi:manganese-dependent inorganic pyrophosphatase
MSKVYVVGHLNPDTDSIAAAMGYAWYLRANEGVEAIAARAGSINQQTAWVLERLGLQAPELISDASPRFVAIVRRFDSVTPDRPLREAWNIANQTGSVAPLVEEDGSPFGLVTGISLFSFLVAQVGSDPQRQQMRLAEILDLPSRMAADTGVPRFAEGSRIRDALPRILRQERDDFWVVDETGCYVGICRRQDLLHPPRMQLVLVDHNEQEQAIAFLEEADLLEVLDHHRLGNAPTRLPISFRIDPVGSTSTLVSERIAFAGLTAPPALAGLLLAGIISDTLLLISPTTTPRDHAAVERVAKWAFIPGSPLEGGDVHSYGREVLEAGSGLGARDADEVVSGDLKIYEAAGLRFGVAQVEVTDLQEVSDYVGRLDAALQKLCAARGLDFAMLMATGIVDGSSRILLPGAPLVLEDLPYARMPDGSLLASGVVSRKKQLLPAVLALLEG